MSTTRYRFDPHRHRAALSAIIREIEAVAAPQLQGGALDPGVMHSILRRHPRDGRGFFSRSQLIAGFRTLQAVESFGLDEQGFVERVRMRPVRTQSGVTPLTVLTHPFPCPGKCIFCPNDVRMPKSYLSEEPGCQRAAQNGFDPYLQTYNRLRAFEAMGHGTDKVEHIVLGGTWSFYPEPYQVWFVRRCFDAMNDFGAGVDRRQSVLDSTPLLDPRAGSHHRRDYNRALSPMRNRLPLAEREVADWEGLRQAQLDNERSRCRSVGLVVETRPDHIEEREVLRLRRLGCTKIQIGYQSLSDEVLALNRRGHDVQAARRATRLLRSAGFKIHGHFMPNLLGADPSSDRRDFDLLFSDPDFRPDELKVYPCSLIEGTELMDHHRAGRFEPYTHAQLLSVLVHVLSSTPRYCRLTRVIRDISSADIVAGNRLSNFRELAEQALARDGKHSVDIRAREIREHRFQDEELSLRVNAYSTSVGEERFLELVTPEDRLVGFCRLSLPQRPSFVSELETNAVIRELHVYGSALALGARTVGGAQHRGLGARLVEQASACAQQAGYARLSVISAVGTRPYYRRLGFEDGELYQHRATLA